MVACENHLNGHENGTKKKAHVLVVTIAFPGHFAPFVQILYHLAAEYPGLMVTVLGNKDRIADLNNLRRKGDLKSLNLRLEEVFGPVPVYHEDPKFPVRAAITSRNNFEECESFRKKLAEQKDAPGGPTAIIADMFQFWSKDIADELGIPWYTYFSTAPMFALNVVEISKLVKAGVHPVTSPNLDDLLPTVPGLPFVRIRDLTAEIFHFDEFYANVLERTRGASAILMNTTEELDLAAGTIIALRKLLPACRVLPMGPSLQHPGFGFIYTAIDSTNSSRIESWLNSHPAKSVLYVAFGSLGAVSKQMVVELAAGLEASGVPFLWALRVDSVKLSDVLPPGFEERTKGRGLIETGWAPQSRILGHPSTGGFLTHCGWNSTLESICAGVPVIAWPLSAEQPMNARFVADVAKVGTAICYAKAQNQDSFDDVGREEVRKAVRELMQEEKGREVRRNVEEVQKSLEAAVVEGGSSYQNLHTLLEELAS